MNFVREYWQRVFEPFVQGYRDGTTPNPDMACNRHIKFDEFYSHVRSLGADWMATGHYARLRRAADGQVQLLKAVDAAKDQSYFLALVRQAPLRRCAFPLGEKTKEEVRSLAREAGLHTAEKRDSTGICFVGKRRCTICRNHVASALSTRAAPTRAAPTRVAHTCRPHAAGPGSL